MAGLADTQGRTVDFRNTVIMSRSNIGSSFMIEGVTPDGEINPETRERVVGELQRHFPPRVFQPGR